MKGSKSSEALFCCVDNIIANFATLVKQTKIIKQDIASFARVNLSEYPHQKTNFDCGFFVILYMETFDGKIMKLFGPTTFLSSARLLPQHFSTRLRTKSTPRWQLLSRLLECVQK